MSYYNCAYCGRPVDAGSNEKEEERNAEKHFEKVCTGINRQLYKKNGTITRK